jgi:hypothetical protein
MFLAYVNCSSGNSRSIIISFVIDYTVYAQLHTWSIHCFYGIQVFYGCNMWHLLCSMTVFPNLFDVAVPLTSLFISHGTP